MSEKFCMALNKYCPKQYTVITCKDCQYGFTFRQRPITPAPNCTELEALNKLDEILNDTNEQIAAEIADMPDDEFKANLESLKKLFPQKYDEFESKQFLKGDKRGAEKMKAAILTRFDAYVWASEVDKSLIFKEIRNLIKNVEV